MEEAPANHLRHMKYGKRKGRFDLHDKWLAGFLFSNRMASWSPPWSGKSPRRLGRVGVECRGCIGGFLCLVSDFKMVKGTYLLSIVGSLQLGFTTRFLPPKFFGTFFSPTSGEKRWSPVAIYSPILPFDLVQNWLVGWYAVILLCFLREISDQKLFLYRILRIESQPCRGMRCGVFFVRSSPWHVRLLYKTFSKFENFPDLWSQFKPKQRRNFSTKNPDKIPTLNQSCLWFGIRVSYGMPAKSRGHPLGQGIRTAYA